MASNKQNNPNFFSGAGITEIEYDINGNPTGTMPVRTTGETQATPAGGFSKVGSLLLLALPKMMFFHHKMLMH